MGSPDDSAGGFISTYGAYRKHCGFGTETVINRRKL